MKIKEITACSTATHPNLFVIAQKEKATWLPKDFRAKHVIPISVSSLSRLLLMSADQLIALIFISNASSSKPKPT